MSKLKILHLGSDEKFIDQAMAAFERAAPGANHLYLLAVGKSPLKFVKSPANLVSGLSQLTGGVIRGLSEVQLVVVHSLDPRWYKTIRSIRKDIPIIWVGWGSDYYHIIFDDADKLLLPATLNALTSTRTRGPNSYDLIKGFVKGLVRPSKKSVISRINFFAPVLEPEYELVKGRYPGKAFPKYVAWNYGNLEDDLVKGFEDARVDGRSILAGNSAYATNNHFDLFDMLTSLVGDRDIVTPLSYGDERYRNLVLKDGVEKFGDRFKPMVDFIPMEAYLAVLQSCGFVVMNHVRQQAVGNIITMLYLGAKVFLRKECPTYAFLRHHGAAIFTIQDLGSNPSHLDNVLSRDSMDLNKELVRRIWSRDTAHRKTTDLLRQVCRDGFNGC